MPRGINLVVTCTKKKLRAVRESLQLHSVGPTKSVESRASQWIKRLKTASGEIGSAEGLYGGDHWSVVRKVRPRTYSKPKTSEFGCAQRDTDSSLMRAGFIPTRQPFSSGHPDSISTGQLSEVVSAHARWWKQLAEWEGPTPGSPRSIAALGDAFPDDLLLVVMSGALLARHRFRPPRDDRVAFPSPGTIGHPLLRRPGDGGTRRLICSLAMPGFRTRWAVRSPALNSLIRDLIDSTTPAHS